MRKREDSRKNVIYIGIMIFSIIAFLGAGAFAYYQTTITGTISGTVSKWNFTANNQVSSLSLDFGELYPGKTQTYNLQLSAENSQLDVYYEIKIDLTSSILDSKLAFDSSYAKKLYYNRTGSSLKQYVGMYGIIPAGTTVTIPLYLKWPYEGDDDESLADGTVRTLANISVVGRQYTGYSGSIPILFTELFNGSTSYRSEVLTSTTGYIYKVVQ